MKFTPFQAISMALLSLSIPACNSVVGQVDEHQKEGQHAEGEHAEAHHKILVTSPVAKDVITTQQYVCQIHSRRHIEVRALQRGYLEEIHVQEGQAVRQGDVMFKIVPVLYQAKLEADLAEAQLMQIKFDNTSTLHEKGVVSIQEVALARAELAKAQAKVKLAQAELQFTEIKAPYDGIIDRQDEQQGSLVEEGDMLTTMSDNNVMWVYFNVPETRYLEYMAGGGERDPQHPQKLRLPGAHIQLQLADGSIFKHAAGDIVTVEGNFHNTTGNIAFRADFPNPDGVLRHGQTGTVLIHRKIPNAIVIPQRATYEILAKQFVFVVEPPDANPKVAHGSQHGEADEHQPAAENHGNPPAEEAGEEVAEHGHKSAPQHGGEQSGLHGVVRQREIKILQEKDDIFLISEGLTVKDRIVLEGIQQVRDGDDVGYEFESPEKVLSPRRLKYHAE